MNTKTQTKKKPALNGALISNRVSLADAVYELANLQLIQREAQAALAAQIEACKADFAAKMLPAAERSAVLFSSIERYVTTNRAKLFEVRDGKRRKTLSILGHALSFRESTTVKAPDDSVSIIKALIFNTEVAIMNLGKKSGPAVEAMVEAVTALESLIRTPEPELNKQALTALPASEITETLKECGIAAETSESFKITFKFTPAAN
jgi:phage host-nuclease inhibitor protein Gam